MKKINILILLALVSLTSYSNAATPTLNNKATANDKTTANKLTNSRVSDERQVSNFSGISAGGSLEIKVTMGNKESLRLEGDADAIANITTEVVDGILVIKPKTKWSNWSTRFGNNRIKVYITAKKLNSIAMSGSGSLTLENTLNTTELSTSLSGSGTINGTANVKNLRVTLSGSGNMNISGKSESSSLTVSGSGTFKGKNFSSDNVSVQVSGSADVYTGTVNKALDAVVSGSGSVNYSGNAVVKKTVIGSGSVSKN